MKDDLVLSVDKRQLNGWDKVEVTRGIELLPSSFTLGLLNYFAEDKQLQLAAPGNECVVHLGNDRVLTGYIDSWSASISGSSHGIEAKGRGKCQDLVDCSAEWPNNVIQNANALQIAQKLAAPYGISVSSDVTDLPIIPQRTLNWQTTPQKNLEEMARISALLFFDTPDGNLFLTRAGKKIAASGVVQGGNVLEAKYTNDVSNRFSDYVGIPISVSALNGDYSSATLASAHDAEIASNRYRKKVVLVNSVDVSKKVIGDSIRWEMNRRAGRARTLQVTVDSWRDASGALWEPNTLLPISLPAMGLVDQLWLLTRVVYTRDSKGTRTELQLMPPEAFAKVPDPSVIKKMEGDK